MRVDLLDPPAYSPAYDDALAHALGAVGAQVRLITSAFAFGDVAPAQGYIREERFYRRAVGPAASRRRALTKRAAHPVDLLRYRDRADVVHWQWTNALDLRLGPRRPTVVTVHDPHGARGIERADAVVVHTDYARRQLPPGLNAHVIPHGALMLPPAEPRAHSRPRVLCFGLIRPYKGIATLLAAWPSLRGADLTIAGRTMMTLGPLPPGVTLIDRYVSRAEQAQLFADADIVVLPYLRSERFGFSGVLATALAASKATVVSRIGGFQEAIDAGAVAAVAPDDPAALAAELQRLIDSEAARQALGAAASQAAENQFSWQTAARQTLALYRSLT